MSSKTGPVGRVFHAMRGKPLGALGGLLIIVLVATALLAPVLAPYDPIKIKSSDRLQAPSLSHLLGTDDFGRDILSRIIYGARVSLIVGFVASLISVSNRSPRMIFTSSVTRAFLTFSVASATRAGSMSTPTPRAPYFWAAAMTMRPSPHPRS